MTYRIALNFEDGVTRFVDARDAETIADTAYRLGMNIPLDCRDGACGACKCKVETGSFESGFYIEDALSDDEAAQGYALACQAKPTSDMAISVLASSAACKTKPQDWQTKMVGVERLSETSLAFTLEKPEGLTFLPGQYVNVGVPGTGETRAYSFSSAPDANQVSFLVRDIPGGLMSGWLRDQAKSGDALTMTGPSGGFYLRDLTRPALFLAGGTGLAPFLSMLGEMAAKQIGASVRLIYGVTNDVDLVGVDALQAYADMLPNMSFTTCVASADSTHERKGYVTDHIRPEDLNGGDVDLYLCGPPAMVEAVRTWLNQQGITPASFHYEKFTPGASAPASKAA